MTDELVRIRGSSCGIRCTVYAYQRKDNEFQCPTCMRLIVSESSMVVHIAQHHPRELKGASS